MRITVNPKSIAKIITHLVESNDSFVIVSSTLKTRELLASLNIFYKKESPIDFIIEGDVLSIMVLHNLDNLSQKIGINELKKYSINYLSPMYNNFSVTEYQKGSFTQVIEAILNNIDLSDEAISIVNSLGMNGLSEEDDEDEAEGSPSCCDKQGTQQSSLIR